MDEVKVPQLSDGVQTEMFMLCMCSVQGPCSLQCGVQLFEEQPVCKDKTVSEHIFMTSEDSATMDGMLQG